MPTAAREAEREGRNPAQGFRDFGAPWGASEFLGWHVCRAKLNPNIIKLLPKTFNSMRKYWERGSGGVQSTGVSQRVRVTGRDESQSVPSPEKLFKTRDLELPFFEGFLPSCSPHSAGYARTFLHPYFPVAKKNCLKSAKKDSKKRSETCPKSFQPLFGRLKIFH